MFDLGPAAAEMSRLVRGVSDGDLDRPTPCEQWTVRELLAHVHQLSHVFTRNARKEPPYPPAGLVDGWRAAIPRQLDELALAWRDETSWTGRVAAGGVEMDAPENALVAVEELTVHGWDLARATGRDLRVDDEQVGRVEEVLALFGEAPFGPPHDVPSDADRLERVLALTGRDPRWSPPAA